MIISNGRVTAVVVNGKHICVQVIPFKRVKNTMTGLNWVEVCKQIQVESGEKFQLNLDGKSFYAGLNNLYKLIF